MTVRTDDTQRIPYTYTQTEAAVKVFDIVPSAD